MHLCVASSDQREGHGSGSDSVDCACDNEKLGVVRRYLHERFPDRTVREFHSHSTAPSIGYGRLFVRHTSSVSVT